MRGHTSAVTGTKRNRKKRLGQAALVMAAAVAAPQLASAAIQTWSGGPGSWNDPTVWSGASWTSSNDAVFGLTAGAVSLSANTQVHNITFNTLGYSLANSPGFALQLTGVNPTITAGSAAANGVVGTINVKLTGTAGLTLAGGSLKDLSLGNSNNDYTGVTALTGAGMKRITADNTLGATSNGTANGTTFASTNAPTLSFDNVNYFAAETLTFLGSGGGGIRATGTSTFAGPINLGAFSATLMNTSVSTDSLTLTGKITGGLAAGSTTLTNSGGLNSTLVLSNSGNDFTGQVSAGVAGQRLVVTANNALGATGAGNDTVFNAANTSLIFRNVNYSALETLNVANITGTTIRGEGGVSTFAGAINSTYSTRVPTLSVDSISTLTLSGVITTGAEDTNPVDVKADGIGGKVILTADNSTTLHHRVYINTNAVLNIQNGGALGTSTSTLATPAPDNVSTLIFSGGALELESTTGITVPESFKFRSTGTGIGGNGGIRNISGDNEITGTLTLNTTFAATIQVDAGTLAVNNIVGAGTGSPLTLQGVASGSVKGLISELGQTQTVTKTGGGTWSLDRASGNTYTGGTTISNGKLLAMNSSGSATGTLPVAVNGTGILGGTGIVSGAVNITGSGRLAPGTSVGTLGTGALSMADTTHFDVEVNGTSNDMVRVIGAVALGSGTGTDLTMAAVSPVHNAMYFIVNNDGFDAVTGLFSFGGATLNEGGTFSSGGATWTIYYGADYGSPGVGATTLGNDVLLVAAVPEPASAGLLALGAIGLLARRRRRA